MQQPNALIRSYSVGAPYKVILSHHDAKAFFGAVSKVVCSAQNLLLGFVCIATKLRLMCSLFVRGKAHDIAPVRDVFR